MKTNKYLLLLILLIAITVGCKKESVIAPVVSTLSVSHAHKNENLTIRGSNFGTDLSKISVTINGKSCTVISATDSTIVIQIPPKCGSGDVIVTVNGASSNRFGFVYDWTTTIISLNDGSTGNVDGSLSSSKWEEQSGLCIDDADNIYTGSFNYPRVRKISADLSTVTTIAGDGTDGNVNAQGTNAKLGRSDNLAVDASGNVYIGDESNSSVRKIDASGNVTTFFSVSNPQCIKIGKLGNIYVANLETIFKFNSAGVLQWKITSHGTGSIDGDSSIAQFSGIQGISFGNLTIDDNEQNIYFANLGVGLSSQIKKLNTTTMNISTIAGTTTAGSADGAALSASFNLISGLALDQDGGLFISDGFNHKIRYLKDGQVSTIIGTPGMGDVDGDASVAKINYPVGIDINSSGEIFIACIGNNKIKKLVID